MPFFIIEKKSSINKEKNMGKNTERRLNDRFTMFTIAVWAARWFCPRMMKKTHFADLIHQTLESFSQNVYHSSCSKAFHARWQGLRPAGKAATKAERNRPLPSWLLHRANPGSRRSAATVDDWRWSSAASYLNGCSDGIVTPERHPLFPASSESPEERHRFYTEINKILSIFIWQRKKVNYTILSLCCLHVVVGACRVFWQVYIYICLYRIIGACRVTATFKQAGGKTSGFFHGIKSTALFMAAIRPAV